MTPTKVHVLGAGILALTAVAHAARRGIHTVHTHPAGASAGSSWGYTRLIREDFDRSSCYLTAWTPTVSAYEAAFHPCTVTRQGSRHPALLVDTIELRRCLMDEIGQSPHVQDIHDKGAPNWEADGNTPTPTLVAIGRSVLAHGGHDSTLVNQDTFHVTALDDAMEFEPYVNPGGTWGVPAWGNCRRHTFSHVDLAVPAGTKPPSNFAALKEAVEASARTQLGRSVEAGAWTRQHYIEAAHAPGQLVMSRHGQVTAVVADGGGAFKRAPSLADAWLTQSLGAGTSPHEKELIL